MVRVAAKVTIYVTCPEDAVRRISFYNFLNVSKCLQKINIVSIFSLRVCREVLVDQKDCRRLELDLDCLLSPESRR